MKLPTMIARFGGSAGLTGVAGTANWAGAPGWMTATVFGMSALLAAGTSVSAAIAHCRRDHADVEDSKDLNLARAKLRTQLTDPEVTGKRRAQLENSYRLLITPTSPKADA